MSAQDETEQFMQNFAKLNFACVIPEEYEHYKEYCIGFEWDKKGGLGCEHYVPFRGCASSVCRINAAVNFLKEQGVWRDNFNKKGRKPKGENK